MKITNPPTSQVPQIHYIRMPFIPIVSISVAISSVLFYVVSLEDKCSLWISKSAFKLWIASPSLEQQNDRYREHTDAHTRYRSWSDWFEQCLPSHERQGFRASSLCFGPIQSSNHVGWSWSHLGALYRGKRPGAINSVSS